jgi:uncharacterized protein YbjT (DUF2867 family)
MLVRKTLPIEHAKLVQQVIDFDRLEDYAQLVRGDDVFCCLGTTRKSALSQEAFSKVDCTYPYEIAKIARLNGAEQYLIVSSVGSDPESRFFYYRVKGNAETAIAQLPFVAVHIFRPSMLRGARRVFRWEDYIVSPLMKCLSFAMVGAWRKYRSIYASAVACAMVHIARQGITGVHVYESDQIQSISDSVRNKSSDVALK